MDMILQLSNEKVSRNVGGTLRIVHPCGLLRFFCDFSLSFQPLKDFLNPDVVFVPHDVDFLLSLLFLAQSTKGDVFINVKGSSVAERLQSPYLKTWMRSPSLDHWAGLDGAVDSFRLQTSSPRA